MNYENALNLKKTLLHSEVVDFEFLGNFCIDHFLLLDILVSKL